MTGTDRLFTSTETALRAPYASPRNVTARDTSGRDTSGRDTSSRDASGRDAGGRDATVFARARGLALTPFVPRAFRDVVREYAVPEQPTREVMDMPSLEQNFASIDDDELIGETHGFADFDSVDEAAPVTVDLPWIDAFVEDEADDAYEAEDEWPMGEAGKRLDELTQSLTSLDASRARQEAEGHAELRASVSSDDGHAMWNEEEWIDIMPTPLTASASTELSHLISRPQAASGSDPVSESERKLAHEVSGASFNEGITAESPASSLARVVSAETAARALEGLAMRVRNGDLQLPAFNSDVAEEAMLAGVLASMLGWRQ